MKLSVGFAGMGIMGRPMAMNAARAGHAVAVWNRTAPRPEDVPGLAVADTPVALAEKCDVVVVMVSDPGAVDAVVWGESGLEGALGPGKTVVNMSTVPPAYSAVLARDIGAKGAAFVDAPVSGSKIAAENAKLVVLAGGDRDVVASLSPLFEALGSKTVYCGEAPKGSMMKMSVNLLLASMTEGLAEMIAFGRAGGLETDTMLQVLMGGPLACDLFRFKEDMLRTGRFPVQFPLKHMAKDLKCITDTAYDMKCQAPGAFANLQLFTRAMAQGLGDEDFAAVLKLLEAKA